MDDNRLKEIWQDLDKRLADLDFEAIWPGFAPVDFALYTSDVMCFRGELAGKPDSFFGNTSVDYQGARIAIWNLSGTKIESPDSLDRLAANLVHEMFHAFQHREGETRFANDLELLLYPQNEILTAWTSRESAILPASALYRGQDPEKNALQSLRSIAAVRAAKSQLSGGATINELRVETTEGLAEYAGYRGLCQINSELAARQLFYYKDQLFEGDYLFDIRRRCYFSGILLAITADKAGLPVPHPLQAKKTFWELLDISPGPIEPLSSQELSLAASLTALENERRTTLLAGFQERFQQKRPVQARIVGYDPMNLTRIDDYLISTHILMIEEGGVTKTLMGDQLLLMKTEDERQVEAVFFETA